MPTARTPARQATSRANGARLHGPATEAGKARSARNGTRHGLRRGSLSLLPGGDREAFTALHAAAASDWKPRDAYEQRWVMELVTCMWRQCRLHALELATLGAAVEESPPSEATLRKLLHFARYGARVDDLQSDTREPGRPEPHPQSCTGDLSPRTSEPKPTNLRDEKCANEFAAPTVEPGPASTNVATRTSEPRPPVLNRHRRRRATLTRKRRAA